MSQGKDSGPFIYNAKGQIPNPMFEYTTETHFADYDRDGFDSYGYSAYDKDGKYVGICAGVDRLGNTENDYLVMDADEFADLCWENRE